MQLHWNDVFDPGSVMEHSDPVRLAESTMTSLDMLVQMQRQIVKNKGP